MDEKDWIIARLLYALYAEGRNADYSDAIKSTEWFIKNHGHRDLLAAYSDITNENRTYKPFWKEGWSKK
jgi:outer membrane protein assembly factor BamD (BamD/ComL family)